ncbi:asparagine synthase-related protein [Streptomyces sp. NPDC093546]|uniref:asparagine synthase-related protein n=1 Tax=Streptomyces sp. NPDC093546 TaxID=3366040 RepID=UPI00380F186B
MSRSCGGRWFVVLPDREAASAVFGRLRRSACRVVRHASGRPWLVGCWADQDARVVEAGGARLVVLGVCDLDPARLERRARELRTVGGVESAVAGARGSFHLLASVAGEVYARGTAAGDRRLFVADVDGITVGADRARTLAWLTGASVDLGQVAARMGSVGSPMHPLDQASMFHGVRAVAPGHALRMDREGRSTVAAWWRPPTAELPLAEGAAGLRDALRGAVAARVRPGEVWASDLSGGMDSTSLCFLAAESGARLVALTLAPSAEGDEDLGYARQAAALLPRDTTHLVFPVTELPPYLIGLDEWAEPQDEPSLRIRDLAQQNRLIREMRAHGADRRLCGQGGDHVVLPPPGHLHDLVRRPKLLTLRQLAGYAAKGRWSYAATARGLLDRRSYGSWLAAQAKALLNPPEPAPDTPLGWGPPVTMPPWATADARALTAHLLREAAASTPPLAAARGQHAWVYQARQAGRVACAYDQYGMPLDMPFCDDAVIEACLRVRAQEAATPWSYKPLLAAAMRSLLPDAVLGRTTKGDFTAEWHAGMKAHQRHLTSWLEDAHLVAAGLAERDALRRAWLSPGTLPAREGPAVESTVAVEAWLRDLAHHPTPVYLEEHPRDSATVP